MCQLLETIRVSKNSLQNIEYHNNRVNRSRLHLFGKTNPWDLSALIGIPDLNPDIVYRCRFLYGEIPGKTEFIPYIRRTIKKLYLVDCGELDYSYKYANRQNLESLKNGIPDKEISDILMVKNGFITDISFANIVFYDGHGWYTPSAPLLKGTKRQYYLDKGIIQQRQIKTSDLLQYKHARLINSMIDLEEGDDISVRQIL